MDSSTFTFTTGSVYTTSQFVEFQNAAFAGYYSDVNTTIDRFELMMGAALGHVPHLSLYMHTTGGDFVGFARTAVRGKRAWCGALAIVPGWRGKKVGSLLIQKYLELLREQSNIKIIQLECINVNVGALRLYKSVGFRTNFEMRDYVIQGIDSTSAGTLPDGLILRSADQVDPSLSFLQYRTTYSWQREMVTVLTIDAMQLEVRDSKNEKTIVAVVAENRADHVRILAIAYGDTVEAGLLGTLICKAAIANGKGQARIMLEPAHSEAIPILERIATRDEKFEEQHMVYDIHRSK